MQLSEEEWKQKLTPDQYRVLREKGTEMPFSNELFDHKGEGKYYCVACGYELFDSNDKYDSSILGLRGWPSFSDVSKSDAVKLVDDFSYGMHRIEIQCANCGGHLGHVFDGDQASPTGKHYCVNATCLAFNPKDASKETTV